ncbi:hypothetical protein VaNZ11_011287 [Volvox africanus]|uniref:Uncharacterized protein n=1 Tax=Volvox africanus TaxID=51714 RepID=A0ABQ5SC12_9CHLO|nr:hypothetical protein VaNZ11_011287 [Volvox africanus]
MKLSRVISCKTHAMGRTGLTLRWLEACQRFSSDGTLFGTVPRRLFVTCQFGATKMAFGTGGKPGAPHASFGYIPLESVIERVCIVRTLRPIVGKRGASDMLVDPKDDDKTSQFVLNNLVGPPPEELLPVVPDEVAEAVREEGMGMQLRPCQVSMRLGAAMAAMEVKAWGWEPHPAEVKGDGLVK